jgi:hypothetical protein
MLSHFPVEPAILVYRNSFCISEDTDGREQKDSESVQKQTDD